MEKQIIVTVDDTVDTPEAAAARSTAEKLASLQAAIQNLERTSRKTAAEYTRMLESALAVDPDELDRLMQLPLMQIAMLPEAKRTAVFIEMGRQIVELPGFIDGLRDLAESGQRASIHPAVLKLLETDKEGTPAALIEKARKLPVLDPKAHIMPNNALMNAMQQSGAFNAGELALPVIPAKGRQQEIAAFVIIDYEPAENETGVSISDPKLSEYERGVANAVISLWVEAARLEVEPVFTTGTIYRAMPGGGETASPQQKGAITRTIEKLRRTHLVVDATDELQKRGAIKNGETFRIDDYFFNMRRARRTSRHSGQTVTAYQLLNKPLILNYAELTGQILSVPAKHLAVRKIDKSGRITPELVTMNADRQALTGYMLRRIAVMRHDAEAARDRLKTYERKRKCNPEQELPAKPLAAFRHQSNVILFDSAFAAAGIAAGNRTQAKRTRDFCSTVLRYWVATGFIKGYRKQTKNGKMNGVIIEI